MQKVLHLLLFRVRCRSAFECLPVLPALPPFGGNEATIRSAGCRKWYGLQSAQSSLLLKSGLYGLSWCRVIGVIDDQALLFPYEAPDALLPVQAVSFYLPAPLGNMQISATTRQLMAFSSNLIGKRIWKENRSWEKSNVSAYAPRFSLLMKCKGVSRFFLDQENDFCKVHQINTTWNKIIVFIVDENVTVDEELQFLGTFLLEGGEVFLMGLPILVSTPMVDR